MEKDLSHDSPLPFGAHNATALELSDFIHARRTNLNRVGHVLITGLSGSGKTYFMQSFTEFHGSAKVYSCSQLFHPSNGETERRLHEILYDQSLNFVVLDNVEVIGAGGLYPEPGHEVERRVKAILKQALDQAKLVIIGITKLPESIDPELLRAGRFSKVINLSVATTEQRRIILEEILAKEVLSPKERDIISSQTHGYSPADLEHLYTVAFQLSLDLNDKKDTTTTTTTTTATRIDNLLSSPPSLENFLKAIHSIVPSAAIDLPTMRLPLDVNSSLVGVDHLKSLVLKMIESPLKNASRLAKLRLSPPKGILIYGPSGSGKTTLALECARTSGLTTIPIQATTIRSKYIGESEKNLTRLFSRARECAPCILFIDQIEGLFTLRGQDETTLGSSNRLITTLLTELDGLTSRRGSAGDGIFILATTTDPNRIDSAILRPGRLGIHLEIPPFDSRCRRLFIHQLQEKMPIKLASDQIDQLVDLTEGFSPAQMDGLFREAALQVLRQSNLKATEIPFSTLYNILLSTFNFQTSS